MPSLNCEYVILFSIFYRDIFITKGLKKRSVSGFTTLHKKIADYFHGVVLFGVSSTELSTFGEV